MSAASMISGPASLAAGGGLAGRLPQPQLLQAKTPGGDREERFARIDPAAGFLRLRALTMGLNDEVEVGAEHSVDISKLSSVRAEGAEVRLAGAGGKELLRVYCDSKEHAKVWQQGLEEVAQLHGSALGAAGDSAGSRAAAGLSDADASHLKDLCQAQEERVQHLESLNRRKEEQLLKLHSRLEEALMVLQAGQATYAEQQKVLEAQQARIETLQACKAPPEVTIVRGPAASSSAGHAERATGASAGRGSGRPAGTGAGGAEAEADGGTETGTDAPLDADTDADTEAEDAAGEMAALARRAESLQRQLADLRSAADDGPEGAGTGASGAGSISSQVAAANQVMSAAPQLLAHLHSLIAEKDRLEEQLKGEQAELQQQLNHLYSQMGEDDADEEDGEDTSP